MEKESKGPLQSRYTEQVAKLVCSKCRNAIRTKIPSLSNSCGSLFIACMVLG